MTPRPRAAFTLIELLIVVVIIGILAAIAIPRFQNTKGRANASALKSDLRNLAVAQEAYFYDHVSYADDISKLSAHTSPGVVITLATPVAGAWVATATHPASYPLQCTLFIGPMSPPFPEAAEGIVTCK